MTEADRARPSIRIRRAAIGFMCVAIIGATVWWITPDPPPSGGVFGGIVYVGGPSPPPGTTAGGSEAGEVVVYSEDGAEVAREAFRVGHGFTIPLEPGSYRLVSTSGNARCPEQTIEVADLMVGVQLECQVE